MSGWLLGLALLMAPVSVEVPYVEQGRAPWCAAAAAVMVMGSQGHAVALRPFVARLRVAADGIAWLDLAEGLAAEGFEAWVAEADDAMLRAALAAGLAPVVVTREAGGTHAVVLTGWDASGWQVRDPAAPGRRQMASLDGRAGAVLIRRMGAAAPDAARWRAGDGRYRATEWRRRAAARVAAGAYGDGLALLDRAIAAQPGNAELRRLRAVLVGQIEAGAGVSPR